MTGWLLAALVFTLVPGSVALAAARRGPADMYERAGRHPVVVQAVLAVGMVCGLGIPAALWYAVFVHRHRYPSDVLHDGFLLRWAQTTVALPRTVLALRGYPAVDGGEARWPGVVLRPPSSVALDVAADRRAAPDEPVAPRRDGPTDLVR